VQIKRSFGRIVYVPRHHQRGSVASTNAPSTLNDESVLFTVFSGKLNRCAGRPAQGNRFRSHYLFSASIRALASTAKAQLGKRVRWSS
jgi:hypothetical protein